MFGLSTPQEIVWYRSYFVNSLCFFYTLAHFHTRYNEFFGITSIERQQSAKKRAHKTQQMSEQIKILFEINV